jgi:hypothetical protein
VLGATYQLSLVTAILLAEIVNYAFNPSNSPTLSMWVCQLQFSLGGIFGAGLLITALAVPESKVWHHAQKARSLAKLQAERAHSARRMSRLELNEAEQQSALRSFPPVAAVPLKGWTGLLHSSNRRWLLLSAILAAGNQLTGINAIMYYAPVIFKDAGFERIALVLTIAVVSQTESKLCWNST